MLAHRIPSSDSSFALPQPYAAHPEREKKGNLFRTFCVPDSRRDADTQYALGEPIVLPSEFSHLSCISPTDSVANISTAHKCAGKGSGWHISISLPKLQFFEYTSSAYTHLIWTYNSSTVLQFYNPTTLQWGTTRASKIIVITRPPQRLSFLPFCSYSRPSCTFFSLFVHEHGTSRPS